MGHVTEDISIQPQKRNTVDCQEGRKSYIGLHINLLSLAPDSYFLLVNTTVGGRHWKCCSCGGDARLPWCSNGHIRPLEKFATEK